MIPNKDAIKDIIDLLANGYRTTPYGYKRREPRTAMRFSMIGRDNGIAVLDRWRRDYELLFWLPVGHRLLVNTDRSSAFYSHEIWRWLGQWGQEAVPVSFGAVRFGGIEIASIRPIVTRDPWRIEKMATKPEDTPSWIRNYYGRHPETGMWGYHPKDPEPDGRFHWTKDVWQGNAEAVFEARYSRRTSSGRGVFLSGWDDNDHPARYFLAQLPTTSPDSAKRMRKPRSMEEARSQLEPPAVKMARQQGVRFVRQGDVFAIETEATTAELEASLRHRVRYKKWLSGSFLRARCSCGDKYCYSYFQRRPPAGEAPKAFQHDHYMLETFDAHDRAEYQAKLRIHGTVHTATELITLTDGTQYARGQLVHQPLLGQPNRPRDHRNVKLDGGKWWLVVRNTVPVA